MSNHSPEAQDTTPDTDSSDDDAPKRGRIELEDRVTGGWRPSPLPPIVDGAPVLEPAAPPVVLRDADWICLRGPCRNYHRMRVSMDAQVPLDGSTTYGDGSEIPDHTSIVHTCYPAPGIEMPLNERVVYECDRWDPGDPSAPELYQIRTRREAYERRAQAELDEIAAAMPEPPAPYNPHGLDAPPADLSMDEQREHLEQRGIEVAPESGGAKVRCRVHGAVMGECDCPVGDQPDDWLEYRRRWIAELRRADELAAKADRLVTEVVAGAAKRANSKPTPPPRPKKRR